MYNGLPSLPNVIELRPSHDPRGPPSPPEVGVQLAGESALGRLTSAEQRDRPGALHGVDNDRSDAPLNELLGWKNVGQLGKYKRLTRKICSS